MDNAVLYAKQARTYPRRVYFNASLALVRGMGLCYDRDYGAAADPEGRRDKHVDLPTAENNMWFAGVTVRAYAAKVGGQWVEIFEPGSVCPVAVGINTVVKDTLLTCSITGGPATGVTATGTHDAGVTTITASANSFLAADAGRKIYVPVVGALTILAYSSATVVTVTGDYSWVGSKPFMLGNDVGIFTRGGFPGRGSALALQTVASAATGNVPVAASFDGSAAIGAADLTLTKTALFTNAVVGDKVVIVGGTVTADGSVAVTVGEYTIATRTSANAAVLDTSPCAGASTVACYVKRGDPTAMCLLLGGPESGLQQVVAPLNGAETAPVAMPGGTTFIAAVATLAGASVITLADAPAGVDRKQVQKNGTLTTSGVAVTSGNMRKASYAKTATFTVLTNLDYCLLQWAGGSWNVTGGDGTAA